MPEQELLNRIAELERLVRQLSDKVGRLEDRPRQPQNPYPQMPPMPYWEPRWDQPIIYGPMRVADRIMDYEVWSTSNDLNSINGVMTDENQSRNDRERS